MKTLALPAALCLAMTFGLTTTDHVQAYPRHHHHVRYEDRRDAYRHCRADQRRSANQGTVIGALVGGLGGNALSHGHVGGTLLGAGAGAVAGHEIARGQNPC